MSKPPNRRMGSQQSATSNALLDAAERVIRNEGYAAASSRRIAEEAGLKQQLVYYYFQTMDELLLATFTRRTSRALERLEQEIVSDQPIETIWRNWNTTVDTKVVFEFFALANHHEGIRQEVARFMKLARQKQASAIKRQFERDGIAAEPVTPGALAFLLFSTALLLGREEAMGVTECHEDVRELFDWALGRLSGPAHAGLGARPVED